MLRFRVPASLKFEKMENLAGISILA